jgi:hypothetical protein
MAGFVVDPGNDGRIKIILPTAIDLDGVSRENNVCYNNQTKK